MMILHPWPQDKVHLIAIRSCDPYGWSEQQMQFCVRMLLSAWKMNLRKASGSAHTSFMFHYNNNEKRVNEHGLWKLRNEISNPKWMMMWSHVRYSEVAGRIKVSCDIDAQRDLIVPAKTHILHRNYSKWNFIERNFYA